MTRSAAKLVVSGTTLRGVSVAASVVVSFFLTPFVIHSLGDQMYGFWTLVGAFVGYYGLMDLGLGAAVGRYVAGALGKGDREEYSKVFSSALQLYVVLGMCVLAITVVTALLAPRFAHTAQDATLFREVILILGSSFALSFPVRAFGGVLAAELRQDLTALIEIFTLLLRTGLVVLVLLAGYKVLALAWVSFLCGLPGMIATVVLVRRVCPWLRFHPQRLVGHWTKRLLSYGFFALIAKLADQLRVNADAFVITAVIGLAAVTHFRIAGLMMNYFIALMAALGSVITPWFSQMDGARDHEAIRKTFFFSTKMSICLAAFVGFGFIAWGRPFIERWMGAPYLDAYPCLVVLALGYVVALGQAPSRLLLYATSKHKFFAAINVLDGLANLGLSLWLARTMGIFGVALGTFIPMVLIKIIAQPLYVCHVSPIRYGKYMREFVRSLLIAGVALVIPVLISIRFVEPNYYSLTAVALTSFVCYALVIGFLEFSRKERETLRRAIFSGQNAPVYSAALSGGSTN